MEQRVRFRVIRDGRILDQDGALLPPDAFDALTNEINDFLMDADGVEDQGLSVTLSTCEVMMTVDVVAKDFDEAVEIGDSAMRFALHSAKVGTPLWGVEGGVVEIDAVTYRAMLEAGELRVSPELVDA